METSSLQFPVRETHSTIMVLKTFTLDLSRKDTQLSLFNHKTYVKKESIDNQKVFELLIVKHWKI